MGNSPEGSVQIEPAAGAPQAVIFKQYKLALLRATAMDRAIRAEERMARKEKRRIEPDNITELANLYLSRMPYKANGCRYHSFVVYFSNIQKLGWVEPTGRVKLSKFQLNYAPGPPLKYFRLTEAGKKASLREWANPHRALYG